MGQQGDAARDSQRRQGDRPRGAHGPGTVAASLRGRPRAHQAVRWFPPMVARCPCPGRHLVGLSPSGQPGRFHSGGPAGARPSGAAQRLPAHQRRGLPWTPGPDAHIGRRGGELPGRGELILVDIDTPAAVDGTPMIDALRRLSDRVVEAGELLDLSATVSVRTPGHPGSGHLPGWKLVVPDRSAYPVRMGPLARCRAVELRTCGTCPGSPGYVVWAEPDQLPVIPRWIADPAGPPASVTSTVTGHGGAPTWARLYGITGFLLAAEHGERNRLLFWASLRAGEAGDHASELVVVRGGVEPPAFRFSGAYAAWLHVAGCDLMGDLAAATMAGCRLMWPGVCWCWLGVWLPGIGGRGRRPGRTAASQARSADLRAWANDQGIALSDRGRIPARIAQQYQAATGGR
jgi:Lsr2